MHKGTDKRKKLERVRQESKTEERNKRIDKKEE